MTDENAPKIQVDSDWKAQAQAEKEKLTKQEASRPAKPGKDELPPADFRSLVGLLASQAISGLGGYTDPQGRVMVDIMGSKFAIDLLAVVEEKTKGNLTPEEQAELSEVLGELRARFVQIAQMVAAKMASGQGVESLSGGAPAASRKNPDAGSGPKLVIP
ncbi:MAG: DUF1844 domain-containing protein [Planctomycetes bacterium]|nr:DUF1844 domain-containing protein [Planctomycetota bacterium]